MRKITVVSVGKLKEPHWKDAQAEYLRRLSPLAKFEVIEVAPEHASATVSPTKAKAVEAERILGRIADGDVLIAMDEHGAQMTSEKFAEMLESISETGRGITCIIGGTEGLDRSVLDKSDRTIALSPMTFTHEMARIFLLEQIYRTEQILRGSPYHR